MKRRIGLIQINVWDNNTTSILVRANPGKKVLQDAASDFRAFIFNEWDDEKTGEWHDYKLTKEKSNALEDNHE